MLLTENNNNKVNGWVAESFCVIGKSGWLLFTFYQKSVPPKSLPNRINVSHLAE